MRSLFWILATVLLAGVVVTYARFGTVEPVVVGREPRGLNEAE